MGQAGSPGDIERIDIEVMKIRLLLREKIPLILSD